MQSKTMTDKHLKILFIVWSVACLLIMPLLSLDAGITEDEREHMEHGQRLLAWYLGTDKSAGVSPFDVNGQWKIGPNAINIYGGFFDLLSATLHDFFYHDFGQYEAKHALTAIFGALLFIFTGLLAQRVTGSWGIGMLALVLATFTPRLFGHAMNNPKDLPFATFFCFSMLQIVSFLRELPNWKVSRSVILALSFSFAIAVRTGGLILIFYFLVFSAIHLVWQIKCKEIELRPASKLMALVTLIGFSGYLGTALFWPWAMNNPLLNPLLSLTVFNKFNALVFNQLFEGQWITSDNLPWYFVPKWIYITIPVVLSFGLVLFIVLIPVIINKQRFEVIACGLVLFSVFFPIASIIKNHSYIYDSARHVLFIIPSIIVLAAIAWSELFQLIDNITLKISVVIAFLFFFIEPVLFTFSNHPLQALYFSPVIDGMKGAFKNYEMDYYGFSVREALVWIQQNSEPTQLDDKKRVRLWYGDNTKLKYFADQDSRIQYVQAPENSTDWDYSIQMTAEAKYNHDLLFHWPPPGMVYEVKVDGIPVSAVIKNYRLNQSANQHSVNPSAQTALLNQSYQYHIQGEYAKAIEAAKKVLEINPQSSDAWNNIAASYGAMGDYENEIMACNKALSINPSNQLAKNNLAWAMAQKAKKLSN